MMLGGTFLFRKSQTFKFGSVASSSMVAPPFPSVVVVSLISLLTRMSRIVIDNNLLTSELKKLLRMVISSICYKKIFYHIYIIINDGNIRSFNAHNTHNRETIFDNFHSSQSEW